MILNVDCPGLYSTYKALSLSTYNVFFVFLLIRRKLLNKNCTYFGEEESNISPTSKHNVIGDSRVRASY